MWLLFSLLSPFFEVRSQSYCVPQAGLKLVAIFLLQLPKCYNCRHVPLGLTCACFFLQIGFFPWPPSFLRLGLSTPSLYFPVKRLKSKGECKTFLLISSSSQYLKVLILWSFLPSTALVITIQKNEIPCGILWTEGVSYRGLVEKVLEELGKQNGKKGWYLKLLLASG